MNYQHAFHAGNFADVHKHVVLTRILDYLRQKPAAFRVIDTHAGSGRYDLFGPQALRSQEWRDGIGRVFRIRTNTYLEKPPQNGVNGIRTNTYHQKVASRNAVPALLAPYLDCIAAL